MKDWCLTTHTHTHIYIYIYVYIYVYKNLAGFFYGIQTLAGCLMPTPVYIYIYIYKF